MGGAFVRLSLRRAMAPGALRRRVRRCHRRRGARRNAGSCARRRRADLRHPDGRHRGIDEAHSRSARCRGAAQAKSQDYGLTRESGFAFVFPGKSMALVNMTHVETPLDPVEMTTKSLEGKEQADRAVAFLRAEYPAAFGNARIRTYGALGIRQTRWIVGRQQLTVEGVRAGRNFPDAVARTGWPIDCTTRRKAMCGSRLATITCTPCRSAASCRTNATTWSRPGDASTATWRRSPACA